MEKTLSWLIADDILNRRLPAAKNPKEVNELFELLAINLATARDEINTFLLEGK